MAIKLSIIIPTYNRSSTLHQALALLSPQTKELGDVTEVIVIDDGSTDDTAQMIKLLAADYPVPLRYAYQNNRGPAAARNHGMQMSKGEWILFLGDDIYAQPSLLQMHIDTREQLQLDVKTAVLGLVTWDPTLEVTPFMHWWGNYRLKYPKRKTPEFVETWRFYTCNVSAHKEFLLSHNGFDEAFPYAALEDTELALRLSKHGLKLYFQPKALAYHHHPTDLSDACRQMKIVGKSSAYYQGKTGLPSISRKWLLASRGPWMRLVIIKHLRKLAGRCQNLFSCPPLWVLILTYSFLVGQSLGQHTQEK